MDKTALVLAFFVAAILAGLFVRYSAGRVMPTSRESFMQQPVGMPLNAKGMGPYDQVSIGSGISGWAANEASPVGVSALPSQAEDPNKLMLMVDNKVSTDCCPSSFNTDTGCVCLTSENKALMASRGGNRA